MELANPQLTQLQQARQRTEKWLESEFEELLNISKIKRSANEIHNLKKQVEDLNVKIGSLEQKKKKAYARKVQVQKEFQSECELKRASISGKEKLIATLKEQVTYLQAQLDSCKKGATHWDEKLKLLVEEETLSCKLLGLQIKKVKVGDCQPKVRDIDQLLERLNATNNLRAFVHTMRKRFVSYVGS